MIDEVRRFRKHNSKYENPRSNRVYRRGLYCILLTDGRLQCLQKDHGEDFSLITKIKWHLILACFVISPSIFVCTFWVLVSLCSFRYISRGRSWSRLLSRREPTNSSRPCFSRTGPTRFFYFPKKKSPRKIDKVFFPFVRYFYRKQTSVADQRRRPAFGVRATTSGKRNVSP